MTQVDHLTLFETIVRDSAATQFAWTQKKGPPFNTLRPSFLAALSASWTSRILVGGPRGHADVIAIDELAAEPSGNHHTDYADGRQRHAPRHQTSNGVVQSQCPFDQREHNHHAVADGVRPPYPLLARARYLAEIHVTHEACQCDHNDTRDQQPPRHAGPESVASAEVGKIDQQCPRQSSDGEGNEHRMQGMTLDGGTTFRAGDIRICHGTTP